MGRRSSDDERQISRWSGVTGSKGRFKNQLINKIKNFNGKVEENVDNQNISPVIRQTLQHW